MGSHSWSDIPTSGGVYEISFGLNRLYVGSSSNLRQRVTQHQRDLERGEHANTLLQRDFDRKSGRGFCFQVISKSNSRTEAEKLEAERIDYHQAKRTSLYNMTANGQGMIPIVSGYDATLSITDRTDSRSLSFKYEASQKSFDRWMEIFSAFKAAYGRPAENLWDDYQFECLLDTYSAPINQSLVVEEFVTKVVKALTSMPYDLGVNKGQVLRSARLLDRSLVSIRQNKQRIFEIEADIKRIIVQPTKSGTMNIVLGSASVLAAASSFGLSLLADPFVRVAIRNRAYRKEIDLRDKLQGQLESLSKKIPIYRSEFCMALENALNGLQK